MADRRGNLVAAGSCDRHAPIARGDARKPLAEAVRRSAIRHSELWRFTRRSVPRAVFAGLFVGIFLMVPGLQIVGAALLAHADARQHSDRRGDDLPVSNPATTPFFLLASARRRQPDRLPRRSCQPSRRLRARHASVGDWLAWLLSDAAPALVSGLFLIGLGVALVGYIVSLVGWRWWIGRKWRAALHARSAEVARQ